MDEKLSTISGARAAWHDFSRIAACLMIVYFHMPSSDFSLCPETGWVRLLNELFVLPSGSLIYFFLIAGYFCKPAMPIRKLLSRILWLLIPYLIWNTVAAFGMKGDFSICDTYRILSERCADYPLWFVHALICMMFTVLIFRSYSWIILLVAVWFLFMNHNEWPIEFVRQIPLPSPGNYFVFLSGCMLSKIPLQKLYPIFLWGVPLIIIAHFLPYVQGYRGYTAALLMISVGAWLHRLLPRLTPFFTEWSKASFLCYAAHAMLVLLLGRILVTIAPSLCASPWFYNMFAPLCYAGCYLTIRIAGKHLSPVVMRSIFHVKA